MVAMRSFLSSALLALPAAAAPLASFFARLASGWPGADMALGLVMFMLNIIVSKLQLLACC